MIYVTNEPREYDIGGRWGNMCEGRVQRRLAAILAADVVGYTRLMGADETGTLARLKTLLAEIFEPEIETHNGRIVKTTGDGVLVEFASAVDAVQCAMVMQPALVFEFSVAAQCEADSPR